MTVDTHDLLTMAEFSRRSGVAPSGVRFYESLGLITAERTLGNQRRFERSELRRVAFVRTAQQVGLSLEEIREALTTLPAGRAPSRGDWARLSASWRPRINARIRQLESLRDRLDSCIGCGCLSLDRCALNNPDDTEAANGPGAVFLAGERI
ncbi:redox-sensitive transcriptional activator SoxR [Propionibacteriaceae bacterium Y2011]|uniref:redox-sensitive transcriptional activator SoxR n=1 Tax=Microlunatus sp. Y2014 TaxID=3418488 RepID=UPI003B4BA407